MAVAPEAEELLEARVGSVETDGTCPEEGIFLHTLQCKYLRDTIDFEELLPVASLLSLECFVKKYDACGAARAPNADDGLDSAHAALEPPDRDGPRAFGLHLRALNSGGRHTRTRDTRGRRRSGPPPVVET